MQIKIRYFASLREAAGLSEEVLAVDESVAAATVWQQLSEKHNFPPQALCAVNHRYASMDTVLADGDEVAFFPPVTGG